MSPKKRKKKKLYIIFILIFACAVTFKIYDQYSFSKSLDEKIHKVEKQIYQEKEKQVELLRKKEYYKSDAYIEKVAREKFGLIKPDEKIFIIKE